MAENRLTPDGKPGRTRSNPAFTRWRRVWRVKIAHRNRMLAHGGWHLEDSASRRTSRQP
jgi:hypothetical protein